MSDNDTLTGSVSEHDLHAWIDGELVEPERSQVAVAVGASPDLAARASTLQTLRGLLQQAYAPDAIPATPLAGSCTLQTTAAAQSSSESTGCSAAVPTACGVSAGDACGYRRVR